MVPVELHDVIGNDEHVVALSTLRAQRGQEQRRNTGGTDEC